MKNVKEIKQTSVILEKEGRRKLGYILFNKNIF